MIYTCTIDTPLGAMTAAAKDDALVGLWFIGQKYYPSQTADWICEPDHPVFVSLRNYLARYFSGEAGTPDIPLAPTGSPFQKAVWVPLGESRGARRYLWTNRQIDCADPWLGFDVGPSRRRRCRAQSDFHIDSLSQGRRF